MSNLCLLRVGSSGPGSSFSPSSLLPDLWLKADVGTYQSATSAGTPAVADGDPVRLWVDQSAHGNNCSQGTSSKRPTLRTNIQNGLPAVRWDGVDDFLTFLTPLTSLTAFSAFFVIKQSGDNILLGQTASATPQIRVGQTANKLEYNDSVVDVLSTTLSPVQNNWSVYALVSDGATVSFYQDGNARGSNAASAAMTLSELSGVLNGVAPINGDLGEFILLTRALTATEITNSFAYCKARWATP